MDLGSAPDLDVGAVADLRQLSDAAPIFHQRADSRVRGGVGDVRRAGRAAGLFFHLVFPHAASAAGDRRRRFHRSPHAACTADQLAGFLCFAGLVCWSRYRLEVMRSEVDETQALEALLEPPDQALDFTTGSARMQLSVCRIHRYLGDPRTYVTILVRKYSRIRKELEKKPSAISTQPLRRT